MPPIDTRHFRVNRGRGIKSYVLCLFSSKSEQIDAAAYWTRPQNCSIARNNENTPVYVLRSSLCRYATLINKPTFRFYSADWRWIIFFRNLPPQRKKKFFQKEEFDNISRVLSEEKNLFWDQFQFIIFHWNQRYSSSKILMLCRIKFLTIKFFSEWKKKKEGIRTERYLKDRDSWIHLELVNNPVAV